MKIAVSSFRKACELITNNASLITNYTSPALPAAILDAALRLSAE